MIGAFFVCFVLFWFFFRRFRAEKKSYLIHLSVIAGITVVLYTGQFYYQTRQFLVPSVDYSLFLQLFDNMKNGEFFQSTIYAGRAPDVKTTLGIHFSPAIVLFFPVYFLFPYHLTMLLLAVIPYAGIAFIFYCIAKKNFSSGQAFCIACCYLIHPAVFYLSSVSFSESPVVSLAVAIMLYSLTEKNNKLFYLCAAAAGLARMDMLVVFPFFAAVLFIAGSRKQALIILTGSMLMFAAEIFWLIPLNSGSQTVSSYTIEKYHQFGSTVGEIARTVLLHPADTLRYIFTLDRMKYFIQMFIPLLPGFFSPFMIPALAKFMLNILSNMPLQHSIYYAYNSDIIIFGMFAVIDGIRRMHTKNIRIARIFPMLCALSIAGMISFSNSFGSLSFWIPGYAEKNGMLRFSIFPLFKEEQNNREIWEIAELMPETASVMVTADIAVAFAQRKYCYLFSEGRIDERKPDYIAVKFAGYFYSMKSGKSTLCNYQIVNDPCFRDLYKSEMYTPVFQNEVCAIFERKQEAEKLPVN